MTRFAVTLLASAALALSACGGSSETDIEKIEAQAEADLSKMKPAEMVDYLNKEAAAVTDILKTVTDEASAKAAVDDLRKRAPKLNEAFKSLEGLNENEMSLSLMTKLPRVMQTQAALVSEVGRIYNIPEARAVIEKELEALDTSRDDTQ